MNTERKLFKWKRVAIDFDGTLVEQIHQAYTTDDYFKNDLSIPVKPGAAETTQWLQDQGFEILIFTCRPDYHRKYMEKILDDAYIKYDYILFYTKPLVDLYIDDKGFRFQSWPATQEWIEQNLDAPFKPNAIGMEPQNDFEDLLRREKARVTLSDTEKSVLDVGCGSGRLWQVCDPKLIPNQLSGVEPDDVLRLSANKTHLFEGVSSVSTWLDLEQYDLVTIFGVLEHVEDPLSLLAEYRDVNEVVATVPNANSFHRMVGVQADMIKAIDELGPQDIEVGHQRVFTYYGFHSLISMFANLYGYKISKFGSCGFKFTNSTEMMQFADRWDAINKSAEISGLVGSYAHSGAELYCRLEKR